MVSHQDLVRQFESEQRQSVFTALADHFHLGLYTDLTLICQGQSLRAHKSVLSASSKFFRDILRHYPLTVMVDLDKELAPHGVKLGFADLQQLVGTLYCVGNLETSPSGIDAMLLVSQVLGIPTLISFLKRVKSSFQEHGIIGSDFDRGGAWDDPKSADSFLSRLPPASISGSVTADASGYLPGDLDRPSAPFPSIGIQKEERTHSRATLASLSSFGPFQASPRSTSNLPGDVGTPSNSSRVVTSVLESFDPSFLNNLQANQIDDLENAILPHLQNDDSQSPPPLDSPSSILPNTGAAPMVDPSHVVDHPSGRETSQEDGPGFDRDFPSATQHSVVVDLPSGLNPTCDVDNLPSPSHGQSPNCGIRAASASELPMSAQGTTTHEPSQFSQLRPDQDMSLLSTPKAVVLKPGLALHPDRMTPLSSSTMPETSSSDGSSSQSDGEEAEGLIIDESIDEPGEGIVATFAPTSGSASEPEIEVNLERVKEGQSFKFAIPGSSKSVTLNFSADALKEMRNSMTGEEPAEVSSSTPEATTSKAKRKRAVSPKNLRSRKRKKRSAISDKPLFTCQQCSKSFSSKRLLDKHAAFHVEVNPSCKHCGTAFPKRWNLEEHLAVEHGEGKRGKCNDCGKEFKWERNLLAHVQLQHPKEIRHRCKFCPLNFIKKGCYISHHQKRHPSKPETWCKFCLEIFENTKVREDHSCSKVEMSGRGFFCHRHEPTREFTTKQHLDDHLKQTHATSIDQLSVDNKCPVCQKKFLFKRNLITHLKRFHLEDEDAGSQDRVACAKGLGPEQAEAQPSQKKSRPQCRFCDKSFLYEEDRNDHENTHKGTKSHVCHCQKAYSSEKALNRHKKHAHTQSKHTHVCQICNKLLSDQYKLKYHMAVHSVTRRFQCSDCGLKVKSRDNLVKHLVLKHNRQELRPNEEIKDPEELKVIHNVAREELVTST